MDGEEAAHGGIGAPQFFAEQRVADVIHARAAVLRLDWPAEEAEFAHAPDEVMREAARFVGLAGDGRDLLRGELARRRLHALLLRCQIKVHADPLLPLAEAFKPSAIASVFC
jgi:hypothetical protein